MRMGLLQGLVSLRGEKCGHRHRRLGHHEKADTQESTLCDDRHRDCRDGPTATGHQGRPAPTRSSERGRKQILPLSSQKDPTLLTP